MLPLPMMPMFMKRKSGGACATTPTVSCHRQSDRLLDVFPVRDRRFFRRARVVGHGVELDDRPAAVLHRSERGKHAFQINGAAAKLDEPVLAVRQRRWGG